MTDAEKIDFWGGKMWIIHWGLAGLTFTLYIPLTVGALICMDFSPKTTADYFVVGWGLFAGFAIHLFTPMVIKYRKKWKQEQN